MSDDRLSFDDFNLDLQLGETSGGHRTAKVATVVKYLVTNGDILIVQHLFVVQQLQMSWKVTVDVMDVHNG